MTEKHPVDDLQLISYFCGDCDDYSSHRIEEHLASCAECRKRLAELSAERRRFLDTHPEPPVADVLPRRVNMLSRPVLALAATLVLLTAGGIALQLTTGRAGYRLKGDSVSLHLYVLGDSGTAEVRESRTYHPGERIQMTYSCGERNHLLLFGIDQTGTVTTYYPLSGDSSVVVPKGTDLPFPHSIELDDYTGQESFVAIFTAAALSAADIRQRLTGVTSTSTDSLISALALGGDASVRVLTITKRERGQ
ncbi:MAG: DUF4384 domain-containing protein [Chitinivibrionales bacterium]|nr:DUF4384 domain-containing protein [Chitinivibrionales bacterium]